MSESDQRLHIHLNFSLLLLAVMGKKCAAQTESRIIDEKVHLNTATFELVRDRLRTAGIIQIICTASASITKTIIFFSTLVRWQLVNWLALLHSGPAPRSRGRSDFPHFLR